MIKKIVAVLILVVSILTLTGCAGDSFYPSVVEINGVTAVEDGRLGTMSKDYFIGVAEGDIAGHIAWSKMGYLLAASATPQTIWEVGGQYVFPVAAQGMEVRSSDNTNDKAGGTGALTVKIYYLTDTFVEKTEVVTMNGTTNVNTVATDIYRVNYFQVVTAGGTGAATGTIDLRNKTDHTTVYARISPTYTRARSTVYTVPINKTLYITDVMASCAYSTAGKSERFTGKAKYSQLEQTTWSVFLPYFEMMLVDGSINKVFIVPQKFTTGVDIKMEVVGETNAQCVVVMRGWLEN